MKTIILDAGHGMSNRRPGKYDPGAVAAGVTEAEIAMDWVNTLRDVLIKKGHNVIRTRIDDKDPAPIGKRAGIAKQYHGQIMLSIHCNAANGRANGTETFYRGIWNKTKAEAITRAVCNSLNTHCRGAKTESQSQHQRLAIMAFPLCFLLELGFIDNAEDRAKMLDPALRLATCKLLAEELGDVL